MKNFKMKIQKMSLEKCKKDIEEALYGEKIDWKKKLLKNGLEAQIPRVKEAIKKETGSEPNEKELVQLFAYQMYIQINQIKNKEMTDQEFLDKAKKEFKEQLI